MTFGTARGHAQVIYEEEPILVQPPVEDREDADVRHDNVGHLKMSLYGTRDAAMNWQEEVARAMIKHGFRRRE